jgi:hypothetical protein
MTKDEILEVMAWAKPLMSLPINLGNGQVLRVKDYQNGQLKFEINNPSVIYHCFLSGGENDHVLTLAPRTELYPGRQAN